MDDKLHNYQKEFVNFLRRLDSIKNQLNELKEDGCDFFIRLENEYKHEKNTPYIPSDKTE